MIPKKPRITIMFLILVSSLLWPDLRGGVVQAAPPVQRTVLPNGLVLLVSQEHSLPLVTFHLLIDAGSRKDPEGQEGLAYLTARGILLGTSGHTATAINEEVDFMGASLTSSATRDYTTLSLRVLRKDLEKGFDLFMEALTRSTFPGEEIRREVKEALAAIQSAEERPMAVAEKAFRRALFLDSPYGHPVEGTKESLPPLTREAMVGFFKTYYHPNNAILTVVGDVSAEDVKAKLIPGLTKWPMGEIPNERFPIIFAKGPSTEKIDRDIAQANIIIGNEGVNRENPDYYALTVMNYILGGGGFSSWLLEEIRVKRGLAYSVVSFLDPGKYPGSFQIVLQTKNSSAREAISLSLEQMERIRRELVSEKELEVAKKYLIGSFPLRLDSQEKLANFLTQVEYYGLGLEYPEKYPFLIRSVTQEEVLRVAKTYLHPEKHILVVVGSPKEMGID
jgi:zinc protease